MPPATAPGDQKTRIAFAVSQGSLFAQREVTLGGPPILLFHGVFSNSCSLTGPADKPNLYSAAMQTSALDVLPINYGEPDDACLGIRRCYTPTGNDNLSANDFTGSDILSCVESQIVGEAAHLRRLGYAYDTFDAIGHSMGSLVAAHYQGAFGANNARRFQIGRLVSIGTPWNGSPVATLLWDRKDDPVVFPEPGGAGGGLWKFLSTHQIGTVAELARAFGHPIGGGVESLRFIQGPEISPQLADAQSGALAILKAQVTAVAPPTSAIETAEDTILSWVDPSDPQVTIDSLLGGSEQHDVVVPLSSQQFAFGAQIAKTYVSVPAVHAEAAFIGSIDGFFGDIADELHTPCIFTNALDALEHVYPCTGGAPLAPSGIDPMADLASLTLTGTQLDPSAVTFSAPQPLPPFGSYTTSVIGTDTCTPQTTFAMDSTFRLQEAAGATPSFEFVAGTTSPTSTTWMVVCTSGDYVAASIPFTVSPPTLQSLQLRPDSVEMEPGETIIVHTTANFAEGSMDVTGDPGTTYSVLGPQTYQGAGAYQATKNGMIFVTVSYGGQSAMVVIKVGDDEVLQSGFE
jgi:pimeloyl-ACP methyl ester carboxylesterase